LASGCHGDVPLQQFPEKLTSGAYPGSNSLPAAGKSNSGHLFNNLSPVKFTSCYKEVDFRHLFNNLSPVKFTSCNKEFDLRLSVQQPATGQVRS
jgi:hypothetical protein